MLKKIAIIVVVLIAIVIIIAATKPDTFSVQRSTKINAPADKIFAQINDFNRWGAWSPWEKLDPAMKKTHSGAANGKGAVYEWEGNDKVGKGRMEITDSSAASDLFSASRVMIKLDFFEPLDAHNIAEFKLEPQGESTQVTWIMHGPAPFISKLFQVFFSMDSVVGKDFEAGLANLKAITEK